MRAEVSDTVAKVTGKRPERFQPLGGGCIGDVYRVELEGGGIVVAKLGDDGSGLGLEGFMLRYLADHSALPVPQVLHAEDRLLIMSWIEGGDSVDAGAQAHAAELLAALHGVTAKRFGFECHTLIGGLDQPNPWNERWIPFFRDQRLLYTGGSSAGSRNPNTRPSSTATCGLATCCADGVASPASSIRPSTTRTRRSNSPS